METFNVGDYVTASWICNSNCTLTGRVERVTKTRVYVRDSRGALKQFNARDKGARFYSWDDYALRHKRGPVLVREASGLPVARGDVLESDDAKFYLSGIAEPHKPESTGRVYVRRMGAHARQMEDRFFPGVFGLVWVGRTDQGEQS